MPCLRMDLSNRRGMGEGESFDRRRCLEGKMLILGTRPRQKEWLRSLTNTVLGFDMFIGARSRNMLPNVGGLCLMP